MNASDALKGIKIKEEGYKKLLVDWAIKICEDATFQMVKEMKTSVELATIAGASFYNFGKALETQELQEWLKENGYIIITSEGNFPTYSLAIPC